MASSPFFQAVPDNPFSSTSCSENAEELGSLSNHLPNFLWFKVLTYCSYDQVSRLRLVNSEMNVWCMQTLNSGLNKAESKLSQIQKEIRSELPRRESERRTHALSRHSDILSAIETRMSLLQITYNKYIESGYTCFIPGKVLDELFTVLTFVSKKSPNAPRAHEILMELRDISSMAMEHFEENVLPLIKREMMFDGVTVLPGGLTVDSDYINNKDILVKRGLSGYSPLSASSSPSKRPRLDSPRISSPRARRSLQTNSPSTSSVEVEVLEQRLQEAESVIRQQSSTLQHQKKAIEDLTRCFYEHKSNLKSLICVLKNHFEPTHTDATHRAISQLIARMDVQALPQLIHTEPSPGCRSRLRAVRRLPSTGIETPFRKGPTTRAKFLDHTE